MCVATDKIHPASPEKALAYTFLNERGMYKFEKGRTGDQLKFVDARPQGPKEPKRAKKSSPVVSPGVIEDVEEVELFAKEDEHPALEEEPPQELNVMDDVLDQLLEEDKEVGNEVPKEQPSASSNEIPVGTSLAEHFRRTGTKGRGVDVLERLEDEEKRYDKRQRTRKNNSSDEGGYTAEDRVAFVAERVAVPLGTNKNRRKQMARTNLVYAKEGRKVQQGLDQSRKSEWKKWQDFHAGVELQKEVLDELLNEGHTLLPTQWIETDKKAHLKKPGKEHLHVPEYKSRLVACGHLEDAKGIRADSPTCTTEGFNLICSFAACSKYRLKTADVTNAYFSADPIDRFILLKPPKSGIPGVNPNGAIAVNKPVYGTKDAGRRFYRTFRRRALECKLVENRLCRSMYSFKDENNKIVLLAGAHVDDIMWACHPDYEYVITKELFTFFTVKEIQEGSFRFCGREYLQHDDYSVSVACKDNTEKILPITFDRGTRGLDDKATPGEIAQARSVIGSLAWISRQTRPELCYQCSRLQSVVATAKVKHLTQCNNVLHDAQATSSIGLYFKSGAFSFDESILMSIHDASWANEEKIIDEHVFPRRSQYGRITCLGHPDLWDGDHGVVHFIAWKSGIIKKMCRSTFRAETQGCCYAMETGVALRAVIAELMGLRKRHDNDWETTCAVAKRHIWYTDCQSLHDYVVNPVAAGTEDKRLEIDLEGLREYIWEHPDGSIKDYLEEDQHDKIRWIDTSTMICDPLTKAGPLNFAQRLIETMQTGSLNLEPTAESQLKKLKQQKMRQEKALAKTQDGDTGAGYDAYDDD